MIRVLLARLRGLWGGTERLDEEVAAHLEMLAAEYQRGGLPPAEARLKARREFGAIAQMREEYRAQRRLPLLDTLAQDVRYALRQLRRSPGFSAAAILTLALGIGANSAIYQVLDAVVFRSLPVRHAEQLVLVQLMEDGKPQRFSYPLYREMAARQTTVAGMFAASNVPLRRAILRGRDTVATVNGSLVSGNYFEVLGVAARRGRCFTPADERAAAQVAVISHAFWQRQFAGGPAIGKTLEINHAQATIVGIMPAGFFGESGGNAPDVWLPMSMQPLVSASDWLNAPYSEWLEVTARLRPDVSAARAAQELGALYRQLPDLTVHKLGAKDLQAKLEPANQVLAELNAQTAHPLFILIGISGSVLLIACCNLANLLLGRATARTHEIGVRLSLGASRGRLMRQLLTESFLLSLAGSVVAAGLARWGASALTRAQDWQLDIEPGWRVLGFTAGVAILATLLFGMAPALSAARLDLLAALRGGRRTEHGGRPVLRLGKALIAVQVSVSLLLLSGAALLGRTLWNLQHQDFGFARGNALMVEFPVEFGPNMVRRSEALRPRLYERLSALPGVKSVALSACGLMSGWQRTGPVSTPERPAQQSDHTRYTFVTPGYFQTLGIRLEAGRGIEDGDRGGGAPVIVLSETAARTLFGKADPVGRTVAMSNRYEAKGAAQVVGVAHDVRFSPRDPYAFQIYLPFSQAAIPMTEAVLRTAGDATPMSGAVRAAIQDLDRSVAVGEIATLEGKIDGGLVPERTMAMLSACFGALALLLTSVGVYGVIAYAVERRTREIGIRVALGAARPQVAGMLLREVAIVVAVSLAVGAAGTLAAGRAIRTLLYGVAAGDVATLAGAGAMLLLVALVAAWLPARRAAIVDPVDILRGAG